MVGVPSLRSTFPPEHTDHAVQSGAAAWRVGEAVVTQSNGLASLDVGRQVFGVSFWSGSGGADDAAVLNLGPGDERLTVNLQVHATPAYTVRGIIRSRRDLRARAPWFGSSETLARLESELGFEAARTVTRKTVHSPCTGCHTAITSSACIRQRSGDPSIPF
jgi:hypothetical protein